MLEAVCLREEGST